VRSLELAELTQKEMHRELEHRDALIDDMRTQLKETQKKERNKLEASLHNKEILQLQQEK
jgi:hypothetical protein